MNLIIACDIIDPPSEGLYFRYLTMEAKHTLHYSVIIESQQQKIDKYYRYLKTKGYYDFIEDFVLPEWNIDGVRLDTELKYPKTILTNHVDGGNVLNILGQIKFLKRI